MQFEGIESTTLEFKREIPRKDQIVKTAIGFSNLYGGRIIVGVDDSRNIIGVNEDNIDDIAEILQRSIYEASTPIVDPKIYTRRIGDKLVLVIEVKEGPHKPYFRTSEGMDNGTYIRMGNATFKASEEMIRELQRQGEGKHYDEMPAYSASRADLSDKLILDFLGSRKDGFAGSVTDSILRSYKLILDEQSGVFPSIGGLLLFGKNPQKIISDSFITCTHFNGISGKDSIASVDCTGNLFEQIEEALQFVLARLHGFEPARSVSRENGSEIPKAGIREVLINAVVHRNYAFGGPIRISIYEDHVEVLSPGLFPGPLDVTNLEQGITFLRNGVIFRIFREAGIVEKPGSGFLRLFSSYRDCGLERPTVVEGLNFIKCILPRRVNKALLMSGRGIGRGAGQGGIQPIPQTNIPAGEIKDMDFIVSLFRQNDFITMALVLEKTGWARATAGRRLKKLIDAGRIEKIGSGRYCHYRPVGL